MGPTADPFGGKCIPLLTRARPASARVSGVERPQAARISDSRHGLSSAL
jgi:hypothetical protein